MIPVRANTKDQSLDIPNSILKSDNVKSEYYFYKYRRKDGKLGKTHYELIYYTQLNQCDRCSEIGSPRKVCYRYSLFEIDFLHDVTLCLSCANKLRPVVRKYRKIKELKKLTNKLRRHCSEQSKNNQ